MTTNTTSMVHAMRTACDLTLQQLADLIDTEGLSRATLGRIERGERPMYPWESTPIARGVARAVIQQRRAPQTV